MVQVDARVFRDEVLKVAYKYNNWLKKNGRESTYSTFCDEFGYDHPDRPKIYAAVQAVRRLALSESQR